MISQKLKFLISKKNEEINGKQKFKILKLNNKKNLTFFLGLPLPLLKLGSF